ncbi:outer membrane lipoprotein carrier protein LolA [Paraglaciecola hydrolytica]|uniref:Outer-membrane lipoprotein carrier protein n=2 Tax=Paraglaciecola hydrolytica TaxID=1799789 RepID=A0A136A2L1_9ALTE|nr:outer membrane lipoprotein carrier protein LolA [Paraglaciecola hydrolytica]
MFRKTLTIARWLLTSLLLVHTVSMAQAIDAQHLLKQRLSQLKTFQAKFSQRVTDAQNTLLQEGDGNIVLQYPNQLYWSLNAPNENILVADGQTLWQLDPFMEQVVAVNQKAAIDNNPLILLTNPQDKAWDEYAISEHNNQFVITPKSQQGEIAKLVLSFDGANLVAMQIIDGQQQVSDLVFTAIKQNQIVDKALFTFIIPDGFELDDQRIP